MNQKGGIVEINLEQGMPLCDQAIRRLTWELKTARRLGVSGPVKLIHGYGSSGTGGRLRVEVRKYLESQKRRKEISGYITGEDFTIFDLPTQQALRKYPALSGDRDLNRSNNGITIVIL